MQAARRIGRCHNQRLQRVALAGVISTVGALTAGFGCVEFDEQDGLRTAIRRQHVFLRLPAAQCEAKEEEPPKCSTISSPSWFRRSLATLHIKSLPIPRLIVKGDPVFRMERRLLKKRQDDEIALQQLIAGAIQSQERDPAKLKALNDRALEIAYGDGMSLERREEFVQRHGCTGWTDEVLEEIIRLGRDRGIVEIGAGNGQWARVLVDRYKELNMKNQMYPRKKFDFVLAYDDKSQLPLDEQIYHKRTKAYHQFFYDKVKPCDSNFSEVLRHFQCRGRVLLIVYPSPGTMALDAVGQYASTAPQNDTIIYVGEGRGGANANDAFFDYLENGEWVLLKILDVNPLGSKGYEKLYVLQRNRTMTT